MNKSNHRKITEEALRPSGLCANASRFVAYANQDSDHQSGPAGLENQHFCGPAETRQVIDDCNELISDSLHIAALLARRGNEEETIDALYFLGRAFHCVQDFYAHSNWIALNNVTVWHGKSSPPNLKFCAETPWDRKHDNGKLYKKVLSSNSNWGVRTFHKIRTPRRSRDDDVIHPNMHLDYERSWADRVITRYSPIGGGTAYKLAHELARHDTLDHWCIFLYDLMERSEYDPRTMNGAREWKMVIENSALPGHLKSRYKMVYNRAKCDPDRAVQNLRNINPFAKRGSAQIQTSREAFHYLLEIKGQYKNPALLQLSDNIFGFDSLIF